jgi:kinetochore protein Spc7/SPC105
MPLHCANNRYAEQVSALTRKYGWLITSASMTPHHLLEMTYLSDLQLCFNPFAFKGGSAEMELDPLLSLSYIGDKEGPQAQPLTTGKRFFLQLIRAHIHSLVPSETSIQTLLGLVSSGWNTALALATGVHSLEIEGICEESIVNDETIAVQSYILLPKLRSKVRVTFEVAVETSGGTLDACVRVKADVVYGELYNEPKMGEYLSQWVGDKILEPDGMRAWGEAVMSLKEQLIARGRKGNRLDY